MIKDFAFSPTPLQVKAGAALTVANDDGTAHTLTANDGAFDTGDLDGGAQPKITIGQPGQVRVPLRDPQQHDRCDRGDVNRTRLLLLVGTAGVLASAWVHFYLYFRGGYRGIAPESFLGMTMSRAFALNAIGGVVIAEGLVLATRFERLVVPAAAAGVLFAIGTLGAFFLSRVGTRSSGSTRPR